MEIETADVGWGPRSRPADAGSQMSSDHYEKGVDRCLGWTHTEQSDMNEDGFGSRPTPINF